MMFTKNVLNLIVVLFLIQLFACDTKTKAQLIDTKEVSPWCIIGFDTAERTPVQRIEMLKELGIKKYGYNRGKGEFDSMVKEFNLAKENDIEITSIFLWLNAKRDTLGQLGESNSLLLNSLKKVSQKPTIWVSFSDNFFEEKEEKEQVKLAAEMVRYVKSEADQLGCPLALYNHHGWFGNPHNQIKVLEAVGQDDISMVYNFHHAQEYVDEFDDIAKLISPHLSFVNLNGVKKEGPQIITIGEGEHEYDMIKALQKEGFQGPWGILGHIKTEDVKEVLVRNLDGLKALNIRYENE